MSLNMKSFTQALAKTAAVIEKTVQTTVQEVTGPKPLQDYELLNQIGSAGPGLVWKLYSAKAAREGMRTQQYPLCVWVLDKRVLSEARVRAGLSKAVEDAFLDVIRADAGRLVRLRHPGVVHVVQALDENKNAMAMVTEPLFASVANTLGNVENIANVPKELNGMNMGLLEVKHGLLQIAETLDFLHNNACLIHRALSPENVLITSSGAWKLGGFSFAIAADQASVDSSNSQPFHYAEYDVEDSVLPLQPSLNYAAPELVRRTTSSVGCSSDIFSFGCLAYHLVARKPFFDCHNNVKMYMNTLTYISSEAFSSIPPELVPDLQRMLSPNESFRPNALDFTGSPFFRNDTRLRALRFLDHMLERDNMQKSEFLKALSDMWKDFDSRVLRYKVLPPLCAELRNLVMQPMILPMVLTIAESQDKVDFELSTLPALVPVLSSASGETLLLLMKHTELIINKTNQENLTSHLLPLVVRAYDDTDSRIQEEALRKTSFIARQFDAELVKQAILPRIHDLALKTTVAAVRVNALLCLGGMVHKLDKQGALEILQTIQRCTAVDRSAPTLMSTLGAANSILKQYGVEFAAEHVLPLLTPLLTAQQLNVQQFAKYMLFVKDILRKIEEKRGVSVTDSGIPQVKQTPVVNGHQSQVSSNVTGTVASTTKTTASWDEDWGATKNGPAPSRKASTDSSHAIPLQPIQPPSISSQQSDVASVEIEWPPRTSSGTSPQLGDIEKRIKAGASSSSSLEDLDPFSNWPPRPNAVSVNNVIAAGPPIKMHVPSLSTGTPDSWAFSSQGTSTLNSGNNSHSFIGFVNQNPATSLNDNKSTNIGSIFVTSKNDVAALKLAPPPLTAVGRGGGRGRGRSSTSASRSTTGKPSTEQPSLLDLL